MSDLCPGVEKMFKNIHQLHTKRAKNYLSLEWGVITFIISCLLTLRMLHTKFSKDWSSRSRKKNARRTTHDGRQPLEIGHLSDSGVIRIFENHCAFYIICTKNYKQDSEIRNEIKLSLPIFYDWGLSRLVFEQATFRMRGYALTYCDTAAVVFN